MPNSQQSDDRASELKLENRDLQRRLHEETQRRFENIEDRLREQDKVLEKILENTVDLPDLKTKVGELDREHNLAKGAAKLGGVFVGGTGLFEVLRWVFWKH